MNYNKQGENKMKRLTGDQLHKWADYIEESTGPVFENHYHERPKGPDPSLIAIRTKDIEDIIEWITNKGIINGVHFGEKTLVSHLKISVGRK